VSIAEPIDPAPDWSAASTPALCCPLCEYNLRGLDQPRCPECGFAFSWSELIRGLLELHPYLFEHQPKRNLWSFWQTYWRDSFPRRFWKSVSPAQTVRLPRLLFYWGVTNLVVPLVLVFVFVSNTLDAANGTPSTIHSYLRPRYGAVPALSSPIMSSVQLAWQDTIWDFQRTSVVLSVLTMLAWPVFTLAALLVFSQSMRQAKIRKRHVLRAVVYGCDFGFAASILVFLGRNNFASTGFVVLVAIFCALISQYRLYFAYANYLRFHMPFVTVLTSQIMVFMLASIVYLQTWTPW
jgi:hypothetical protein